MIDIQFDNENAQAWLRTRLHRASAVADDDGYSNFLMEIRDLCYDLETRLSVPEAIAALDVCENKVGDDPGLVPARQRIINQLKTGLKEAA